MKKAIIACVLAFAAGTLWAGETQTTSKSKPAMWDGKYRGMELITIGHKKVTIYLADGRTTVLGVPILVEQPQTALPATKTAPTGKTQTSK